MSGMSKPKVISLTGRRAPPACRSMSGWRRGEDIELLLIDADKRKGPGGAEEAVERGGSGVPLPAGRGGCGGGGHGGQSPIPGSSTPPPPTGRRRAGYYGFPELSKLQRALICESRRVVPTPAATPRGLSPSVYPSGGHGGAAPGLSPDLLLPHRLLRRRQEDDRPIRGCGQRGGACSAPAFMA